MSPRRWIDAANLIAVSIALSLFWCFPAGLAAGEVSQGVLLTPAEEAWLRSHPVIRFAPDPAYPPLEFYDEGGVHSGMAADYLDLVEERLGVKFREVPTGTWAEALELGISRKADVLPIAAETAKRQQHFLFTEPYLEFPQVIIVRRDNPGIGEIADLRGKRVVTVEGFANVDFLEARDEDTELVFATDIFEALVQVSLGSADAVMLDLPMASYGIDQLHLTNLRIAGEFDPPYEVRMAVRRDWPELVSILQKTLGSISPEEHSQIRRKWISMADQTPVIQLSPEEWEWLRKHPVLRFGTDPDWPPFQFVEEGVSKGMIADYLRYFEAGLGIQFELVESGSWSEARAKVRAREIDALPYSGVEQEDEPFLRLTTPFLSFPLVVVTRHGSPLKGGLEGLAGSRVAITRAHSVLALLSRDYPKIEIVLVETLPEALEAVSHGDADAFFGNIAVATYLIDQLGLTNLKVSDATSYGETEMGIAIRSDWPILGGILQKALDSMTTENRDDIRRRWIGVRYEHQVDFTLLWKTIAGALGILGLVAIWQVLARRQKEALKRSEERFQLAMDAVDDGLWDWEFSTDDIYFSPGFYTLLGWEPDAFPGRREEWNQRIHPEDRERVVAAVDDHLRLTENESGLLKVEFRMVTRSGAFLHVMCRGNVVAWDASGRPVRGVGTIANVTERKQAEERLRTSHEVLRTVLDSVDAFVYVADMETYELLFLNHYGKEQWGDLTGRACWQVLQEQQDGPCSFCTNNRLLDEDGRPTGSYRWEFQNTVNGRWCDISDRAIEWVDGRIVRLEIATDITERKKAETELVNARLEAEQANTLKSRFLANMSHEIRTPMNVIVGMSHLMQQTDLTAKQGTFIHNIHESSHVLLGVINDILDLSKIESGKLSIEETDFLLCDILNRVSALLGTKAADKGVDLIFAVDPQVEPALRGDPLRLEQVLINLVQNALKFTEQGEVVVEIERTEHSRGRMVLGFSVADTGIGIEPEILEGLFDAFTQGDTSTSRKFGGSGLGLAICRHLVELMGGTLEASSRVGQGSRFSFTLPFALSATETSAPDFRIDGARILVVERNQTVCSALDRLLKARSVEAVLASSVDLALKRIDEARRSGRAFDAALVDGEIAGDSLPGVLARFEKGVGGRMPPTIITSPHRNRKDEMLGASPATRTAFLAKPICPAAMWFALREILDPGLVATVTEGAGEEDPHSWAGVMLEARALVVEDNLINQQVAQGMLEACGLEVTLATSGAEAIEVCKIESFDVIFMDIHMPDMDGFEATRRIREISSCSNVPIIALTAHAMSGDRERCLEAGLDDHVAKPIDPDLLVGTLSRWVGPGPRGQSSSPGESTIVDQALGQGGDGDEFVHLDVERGIRQVGGSRVTYLRLLRQFIDDHRGAAQEIREAV
ncbi:MAG: transporter substrate-binding domain-containing protein, partial [Acidobacteriota bacterium]